ncbi:hypothetical protein GCM10010232_27200 [Streptomyces amakusaensis]|uniref:Integral membrane protein n=1 Tax=Streptomyces amakusaensis TaxID=67271 RepID=A0ABW0AE73_9ACTN
MTTMGAGSALRLAHTAVLAAVGVVVSGLGHDLSSGASVSVWGYLLALPLAGAAAWRLTRTERSARAVVGTSAVGQLALHVLFGLVSPHGAHGAHGGPHGAGHSGAHALSHPPAPPAGALDITALASPGAAMAGAHLLAGAVCGWWLWRGERALVQLARALDLFGGGRLRLALAILSGGCAALPAGPAPAPTRAAPAGPPASLVLLRALSRRGPPLLPS